MNGVESRVDVVETSLGSRITAMDRSISDHTGAWRMSSRCSTIGGLSMDASMEEFRSKIGTLCKQEGAIEKMWEEMTALCKSLSRVVLDAAPAMPAGILSQPLVTAATSSAGHPNTGPLAGHHVDTHHREFESLTLLPVKGTLDLKSHPLPQTNPRLRRSLSSPHIGTDGHLFSGEIDGVHDQHMQLAPQYSSSSCRSSTFRCSLVRTPRLF